MAVQEYDFELQQLSKYEFVVEYREDDGSDPPTGDLIDTSPYDAFMEIRDRAGGTLFASFSSTGENPAITLDAGVITITIGATTSQSMTRDGCYDVRLVNRTDPDDAVRLIEGKVTLDLAVTGGSGD